MRKIVLIALFTLLIPNTWQNINSETPKPMNIELISSDINKTEIKFIMDGFHLIPSGDPKSLNYKVQSENGASILKKDYPDLHNFSKSIIIPDNSKMSVNVISYKYHDYENINVIPSKGNLTRDINPEDVPVTYGDIYKKNDFFPSNYLLIMMKYIKHILSTIIMIIDSII